MSDEPATDQEVEQTSEEPTTTDEPAPSGPWADQLTERFENPEQRAAVDAFLREQVQPHVTKLEQATVEARDAQRLWDDFRTAPVETYAAVTEELFGDELAPQILRVLNDDDPEDSDLEDLEDFQDDNPEAPPLPPEIQELIDDKRSRDSRDAYESALKGVKEEHEDDNFKINEQLFHPFVVAADGDFDAAVIGYKEWLKDAQESFGLQAPSPDDVSDTPPPTIDSSTRSPSTPPVQKEYKDLDEAIDDFLSEQRDAPKTV